MSHTLYKGLNKSVLSQRPLEQNRQGKNLTKTDASLDQTRERPGCEKNNIPEY